MAAAGSAVAPPTRSALRRLGLAVLAAAAAALVVIARRPDAVLKPQFWAEDALVWYAQAYSLGGLHALWIPYGGYLQTLPRIVAALAVKVPFAYAPALMNAWGILFQVLPVFYLLSGRLDALVPSRWVRLVLAALYLLLPYSYEVDVTVTNAQWHLAVLTLMIALGSPPPNRLWWAFDLAALVLSGLTGLFAVVLGLVMLLKLVFVARDRWSGTLFGVTVALGLLQLGVAHFHPEQRPYPPAGLHPQTFAHVLGGPLLVAPTLGTRIYTQLWASSHWTSLSRFPYLLAAVPAAISAWAAWRGPWQLRLALLYVWVQLVAVFLAPQPSRTDGFLYSRPPLAGRYYFAFYAVWFAALVTLLLREPLIAKAVPAILLALSATVAIPADFVYPPLPDFHFERAVSAFEAAPPGALVRFEVPPRWIITLHKRR